MSEIQEIELQELTAKGQQLVDEVRDMIKNRTYDFDLTVKMELKNSCKEIERYISKVSGGKGKEKHVKHLQKIIQHLETIVQGLAAYYSR